MARFRTLNIAILLATAITAARGSDARAEGPSPTIDPKSAAPPAPVSVAPATISGHFAVPSPVAEASALEPPDATAAAAGPAPDPDLVGSEVVEVWAERPDKPFDRDTELRLTGEELAARGVTDLAGALALVPELVVRDGGRGGQIVDIRGARKNDVKILVDGIAVADPYYGTFDVSSIPVTDIAQLRVSTQPSSPIDGTGGAGGVIEVHTRDAIGGRMIIGRALSSSMPTLGASATARAPIGRWLGVRASATEALGFRDLALPVGAVPEDHRATSGAVRVEYRRGDRRVVLDGALDHRGYVVPPSEDQPGDILVVDGETSLRVGAQLEDRIGRWQLESHGYAQSMARRSRYYPDATLMTPSAREDLAALRTGGAALATRPIGTTARAIASLAFDHESADVTTDHGTVTGATSIAQAAAGGQYEDGAWRVDGAVGAAVPLGLGAAPWPEGKLTVTARPTPALAIAVTVARKGRLPVLRDRFRPDIGNRALGPERADFAEVKVMIAPVPALQIEHAGYARRTHGLIHFDPATAMLVNLGTVDLIGLDSRATWTVSRRWSAGASYGYMRADAPGTATPPLDFLPTHRGDAWVGVAPWARLALRAEVRHVGWRTDRGQALRSYDTVEVTASARLGGDWLAVARCDDVTDARWQIRSDVRSIGRIVSVAVEGTWK
jgi:hypothetical protein